MVCRISKVQIQPRKCVLGHADDTGPTWQYICLQKSTTRNWWPLRGMNNFYWNAESRCTATLTLSQSEQPNRPVVIVSLLVSYTAVLCVSHFSRVRVSSIERECELSVLAIRHPQQCAAWPSTLTTHTHSPKEENKGEQTPPDTYAQILAPIYLVIVYVHEGRRIYFITQQTFPGKTAHT